MSPVQTHVMLGVALRFLLGTSVTRLDLTLELDAALVSSLLSTK
jgi:hypothetical protein